MTRQYDICKNPDRSSRQRVPFLLVLQSDLLSPLDTVIVAPVSPERPANAISKLNPVVMIENKHYRVSMIELAGVPRSLLGDVVANVARQHTEFVAAIDLLFTGV